MQIRRRCLLPILILAAYTATAHDLYLMPSSFVTRAGIQLPLVFQNGDEFPQASSPVKPERLRDTKLMSKAGTAQFEAITAEATRTTANVRVPGAGVSILTARTIPNFIELEAAKFEEYLTHENLTEVMEARKVRGESGKPGRERYSKYVKSMVLAGQPDDYFSNRTGLTIEIVPERNPYTLRPGGSLPVQLFFRGKPAANVAVESAWLVAGKAKLETIGRTDAHGRIVIPIKAAGPHRLHAIFMERCAEPQVADWESFWASLTFAIPQ